MTVEPVWLLDTSVILDLTDPTVVTALPEKTSTGVVTSAEPAAGPLLTDDPAERSARWPRRCAGPVANPDAASPTCSSPPSPWPTTCRWARATVTTSSAWSTWVDVRRL